MEAASGAPCALPQPTLTFPRLRSALLLSLFLSQAFSTAIFRPLTFVSQPLSLDLCSRLSIFYHSPSPFHIRLGTFLLCRIASCQPSDIIHYYQPLCSPLIFTELAVLASLATITPPTYPPFSPPAAILEQAEQNALIFTNQVLGRFTHSVSHYSLSSFQRHQRIVG